MTPVQAGRRFSITTPLGDDVLLLRKDAVLLCGHMGVVQISASQGWVTVEGKALLVDSDPENKTISGCPNLASGQPCVKTGTVLKGYSTFIRIDGNAVCRQELEGLALPMVVYHYAVASPGQHLVSEAP